jgi:hypothetical protein
MSTGMPVLRGYAEAKFLGQAIDYRNDLIASRHGQCSARAEIVLNIDGYECALRRIKLHAPSPFNKVTE